jgi:hypothetical protein
MSTINPIVAVACGFVGCTSGVVSGAKHSILLAVAGALIGMVLGIASFWGPMIPYVGYLILHEKWHLPKPMPQPPRIWVYLFLPLMLATLVLNRSTAERQ